METIKAVSPTVSGNYYLRLRFSAALSYISRHEGEFQKYCFPLSSLKPKHSSMKNDVDFSKIIFEKLEAVLRKWLETKEH